MARETGSDDGDPWGRRALYAAGASGFVGVVIVGDSDAVAGVLLVASSVALVVAVRHGVFESYTVNSGVNMGVYTMAVYAMSIIFCLFGAVLLVAVAL